MSCSKRLIRDVSTFPDMPQSVAAAASPAKCPGRAMGHWPEGVSPHFSENQTQMRRG